jgi:hypothetical protein
MPSPPLPNEAKNYPAGNFDLFDFDCLDRTLVGGLLGGIFVLRRDLFDNHFGYIKTHLEYFRAGLNAKTAGSTAIVNSDFHNFLPHIYRRKNIPAAYLCLGYAVRLLLFPRLMSLGFYYSGLFPRW